MSAIQSEDVGLRPVQLLLAVVGLVVFVAGIVIGIVSREGELAPVDRAVTVLGSDYLVVALLALLALVLTTGVLLLRGISGVTQATPPPVEVVQSAPTFGVELEEEFDRLGSLRVTDGHRDVHARLRRAAIGAVIRSDRRRRSAAAEVVAAGEWTDDPVAASFVADETLSPPPLSRRIRSVVTGEPWFEHAVEQTVEAIERRGPSNA